MLQVEVIFKDEGAEGGEGRRLEYVAPRAVARVTPKGPKRCLLHSYRGRRLLVVGAAAEVAAEVAFRLGEPAPGEVAVAAELERLEAGLREAEAELAAPPNGAGFGG
jgi:hypothetical protein